MNKGPGRVPRRIVITPPMMAVIRRVMQCTPGSRQLVKVRMPVTAGVMHYYDWLVLQARNTGKVKQFALPAGVGIVFRRDNDLVLAGHM